MVKFAEATFVDVIADVIVYRLIQFVGQSGPSAGPFWVIDGGVLRPRPDAESESRT